MFVLQCIINGHPLPRVFREWLRVGSDGGCGCGDDGRVIQARKSGVFLHEGTIPNAHERRNLNLRRQNSTKSCNATLGWLKAGDRVVSKDTGCCEGNRDRFC